MVVARTWGAVVDGVGGVPVLVEVDVAQGLPSVGVIGLPDTSVGESRWRARSAIGSVGATWPVGRVTVGLSPADLPKQGSALDLAIAVAILLATAQVPDVSPDGLVLAQGVLIGELGLDGSVRPVSGALSAGLAAHRQGLAWAAVAADSAPQLACIPGLTVIGVSHLAELVGVLREGGAVVTAAQPARVAEWAGPDLADVRGHAYGRFALEVAAAGGHHLAMIGRPGVGKTLLATCLAGLLPDLGPESALEVAAIRSAAGEDVSAIDCRPPFVAPHHRSSAASLIGTSRGRRVIAGAVTRAHRGLLFLDEAPEFARDCLEALRQPLESGSIHVLRVGARVVLPARIQLVLAANPCPCGLAGSRDDDCRCTPLSRRRYRERLSGPLMDRVDIRLDLGLPTSQEGSGDTTESARARIVRARERAGARLRGMPWAINAAIPGAQLRRSWPLAQDGALALATAEQGGLSARGADQVARVAWTLADLDGVPQPGRDQVMTALGLRGFIGSAA